MSESHAKRKSDFSIARILSEEATDIDKPAEERLSRSVSENYSLHHNSVDCNQPTEEMSQMFNGQQLLKSNVCAGDKSSRIPSDLPLSWNTKNPMKICGSLKSESELQWLQCTRYRPPRLPRRTTANRSCKRRPATHPRIPFTSFQLEVLEDKYKSDPYLTRKDVLQLSGLLRLPQSRVKIWFQNRRARDRRENKVSSSLPIT